MPAPTMVLLRFTTPLAIVDPFLDFTTVASVLDGNVVPLTTLPYISDDSLTRYLRIESPAMVS
jgi:hypothetical protein